ncbi:Gldg family protein [Altericroceibacterium spongiae]|uniref:Gldg family protein n=1 Tax=Altericroceibacterium spongiae TaxID=2320269 RepID=UPI00160351B4|nr:ABC transporter [Altericroceibacterium spongiae]
MSPASLRIWFALTLTLSLTLAGAGAAAAGQGALDTSSPRREELAIMGTIPVYWGEVGKFGDLLTGKAEPHWARAVLEERYRLEPLSTLSAENLEGKRILLLAQPRPLAPSENVALDDWVRSGGHLLLFADPMMTGHSAFPIGDKRRPQDVILLSPILARWGLQLHFDDLQPEGPSEIVDGAISLPVNLPGFFSLLNTNRAAPAQCTLAQDGVLAECAIGEGRVVIWADGAVLDHTLAACTAPAALRYLTNLAYGKVREASERNGPIGDIAGDHRAVIGDAAGYPVKATDSGAVTRGCKT